VHQTFEEWWDKSRQRALPVRIRIPAGDAPCGLLLYSHGLGGSREGGGVWGRAWRDAGFMVVHLQHPGSDAATARQGVPALIKAASAEQLRERMADVMFVLSQVLHRRSRRSGSRRSGTAPWSRRGCGRKRRPCFDAARLHRAESGARQAT
jgi:predicted dienelactone hydrolase